jgi:hypothetical protein
MHIDEDLSVKVTMPHHRRCAWESFESSTLTNLSEGQVPSQSRIALTRKTFE